MNTHEDEIIFIRTGTGVATLGDREVPVATSGHDRFTRRLPVLARSASATLALHRSALDSDVQIARVDDLVEAVGDETCCCHAEKPAAHPSRL